MMFRKKRSQYFWVFSSYSFVLHLAGVLALIIFIGTPTPQPNTSPIPVRLVSVSPPASEIPPSLKITNIRKASEMAPSPPQTDSEVVPSPKLFHMIPPVNSLAQPESDRTQSAAHPLVQVAINALIPVNIAQTLSSVDRTSKLESLPSRILVDHKAGNSLVATTPPKILYNPVPQYPKIARELGLEGKTLLRVEILQDGRPGTVKVRESCGHQVLDEAATKAIKNWKFAPAQDGQFTVRSVVDLPIRFSLKSLG